MRRQDMFFERFELRRQALEREAKLFRALILGLPAEVRNDRAFNLHASGQMARDYLYAKAVGVLAMRDGGPGNKHA